MLTVNVDDEYTIRRITCPNPDCGWTHSLTPRQYENPRYFIPCDCGYDIKPNRPPKNKPTHEINDEFAALWDILVAAGYSKREAQERTNKVFSASKTFEDMFKEAVSL